jgi:hypothetical protein
LTAVSGAPDTPRRRGARLDSTREASVAPKQQVPISDCPGARGFRTFPEIVAYESDLLSQLARIAVGGEKGG